MRRAVEIFRTVKEWLYPHLPVCIWCGERFWPEGRIPFCPKCMRQLVLITGPQCGKCGKPLRLEAEEKEFCFLCRQENYFFSKVRGALIYEGLIKQLLYRLKYYGHSFLGEKLGNLMVERIKGELEWFFYELIIPIPISAVKFNERGYNQADLLARVVSGYLRRPVAGEILIRSRDTVSQNRLSLSERQKNMADAFWVAHPAAIANKKILLIDDIFTSGATLSAAAKILLKNGARRVDGLVLALGVTPEQWLTKKCAKAF